MDQLIIHHAEANAVVEKIADERVRRGVLFGLGLAVRTALEEKEYFLRNPDAVPVDLYMYANFLRALLEQRTKLEVAMETDPSNW
jgi:hypothetical protein